MGFLRDLRKALAATNLLRHVDPEEFRDDVTPENALAKLEEYNENPHLIAYAQRPDVIPGKNESLMNTFEYAAGQAAPHTVLDMARYLNTSVVFTKVAPAYYTSTTANIFGNLLNHCPQDQRHALIVELERRGHLQEVMRRNSNTVANAPRIYFEELVEGIPLDQAKCLIRSLNSFQVAKKDKYFILNTRERYPQFSDLLV